MRRILLFLAFLPIVSFAQFNKRASVFIFCIFPKIEVWIPAAHLFLRVGSCEWSVAEDDDRNAFVAERLQRGQHEIYAEGLVHIVALLLNQAHEISLKPLEGALSGLAHLRQYLKMLELSAPSAISRMM